METLRVHTEQHNCETADRHAESLYTVPGVFNTKQFGVRVHVQLGRGHVSSHLSAEDIHHGGLFSADIEAQALETPVDSVGRVGPRRRSRPAQQYHR